MSKSIMAYLALVSLVLAGLAFEFTFRRQALAPASEPRLALVIGNADYSGDPLATAVNDAGLVADALRAAGFEVSGAANLDQDSIRRAFWDFLSRAAQAGPRAIIFVYLSGRGLQYQGENYFASIGAAINRVGDAPTEALRVSDFTQALASMPLRARIFVLDAARENRFAPDEQPCGNRFAQDGQPFAGGLARRGGAGRSLCLQRGSRHDRAKRTSALRRLRQGAGGNAASARHFDRRSFFPRAPQSQRAHTRGFRAMGYSKAR